MYVPPDYAALTTPRDLNDWHDDDGDVLWWFLVDGHNVAEPPEVGCPLNTHWPWFTYIKDVAAGEWVFEHSNYPEARLVWTPLPQIARYEPLPAPAPAEEK